MGVAGGYFGGRWPLVLVLVAALLGGLALFTWSARKPTLVSVPFSEAEDIPALVARLEAHGIRLRLVPTNRTGPVTFENAFLTNTPQTWEELNSLAKIPEHVERWRGTLYCERLPNSRDTSYWGHCGMQVGPFLLFGDPDLLDQVRLALQGA
jgi:hypothetical protein